MMKEIRRGLSMNQMTPHSECKATLGKKPLFTRLKPKYLMGLKKN